jgi:hypothetical protein
VRQLRPSVCLLLGACLWVFAPGATRSVRAQTVAAPGAVVSRDGLPADGLLEGEAAITDLDRDHWSFAPLERPAPPPLTEEPWPQNPIDLFVLQRLVRKGLRPLPPAPRAVLIRRVTFGLTGLPPTADDVEAFVTDPRKDAYRRLVDRLLASPAYGEHQAQAWLDLARFAESDGFEHDKTRPRAWRYRDWVIDALNRDLPYDRFLQLQLAGDVLEPNNPQATIATAFCLSGPDMPDINSQEERRHDLLNELTATVGASLLGLQLGCAQCHDHKYDPLSQADFYRLRAIFEPSVQLKKNESVDVLGAGSAEPPPGRVYLRGDWRRPGPVVQPDFPRIANPFDGRLMAYLDLGPSDLRQSDKGQSASDMQESVERDLDAPASGQGSRSAGARRVALARWLTRPDHPLTSRVMVNRVWQQHFGRGLSETPSDFGLMGDAPSHPLLLDWLATELVRRQFSLKALHRLIVTSGTYCQASQPEGAAAGEAPQSMGRPGELPMQEQARADWLRGRVHDPTNRWLSRFPRQRLSGEMLRDALFAVSGSLNREAGGPGVRPPLPPELVATLLRDQWTVSPKPSDHYRRSVYVFARRNLRYPIFDAFDRPDANASCPLRSRSTTAPQALLLLNAPQSLDAARRLAGAVFAQAGSAEAGSDRAEIVCWLYRQALARSPDSDELRAAEQFFDRQQELLAKERPETWAAATPIPCPPGVDRRLAVAVTDLCLALMNGNEFLYID